MKNSKFHTNDVKSIFESKLKIQFRKGKELNGWFVLEGKKTARITIPKGRKPIPPKTYSISEKDFGFDVGWASGVNHTKLLLKKFRDAHRLTPKTLSEKLYKSMALQLKLSITEFDNLLECPLTLKDYKDILTM